MVMPVMTRLHKITGNALYLEKLHEYWQWQMVSCMMKKRACIIVMPNMFIPNGKPPMIKDFWARGNGWVFAAFARVLADLPETDPYRDNYIQYYTRMAEALAQLNKKTVVDTKHY